MRKRWANGMKSTWQRFALNHRANVTIIFAVSSLGILLAAGGAVDFERTISAKYALTEALDSAAIYAANLPSSTTNQARNAAVQNYVNANYNYKDDVALTGVTVTNYSDHVAVNGTVTVQSAFMQLAGVPTITVPVGVEVQKSGINLEVSLVLDNTGSMNSVSQGAANPAIVDMKAAAVKFVDTVMPATQGNFYTKIAVVPYNNSVNLGSSALAASARGAIQTSPSTSTTPGYSNFKFTSATNQTQTYPSTNCVTERQGSEAYSDASTATYPVGLFYGPPGYNGCTVTPIVPLSTSASTLDAAINSMSAGNSTAGQVGIAWGWYTLSPAIGLWSGNSIPAGYDKLTIADNTQKVKKIMVLMTDAEYNSAYCNGVISQPSSIPGSGSTSYQIPCSSSLGNSYAQANAVCSAAKAIGIEVYVITFQLDTSYPQRVALTQNCATDAAHILNAASSTDLDAVFTGLANSIANLYVSK